MFDKIKNMFQKKETNGSSNTNTNNNNNSAKGVCKTTDIPVGSSRVISWEDEEIAIFNVDNQFYAISNVCAHRGGPLGEGTCDGKIVTCPWHMWKYDVTTGECVTNSAKVKKYKIEVIDGELFK